MTAPLSLRLTAVVVGLLTAMACDSKSPSTPDAAQPSLTSTPLPAGSTGATLSGVVSNGGSATGALMPMAVGGMSGVVVSVSGTALSATTDSTGRFSLTNVPAGQVTLQFTGAATGTMGLDDVAEHETIEIEVHVHNGQVEDAQAQGNGAEAQLEGKIASVNGGAHSFVIGQITVMVPSTATIRHGDQVLTFADLGAGARVHVKGNLTGSTLTASRVEVQQSGGPGPGNGNGNDGNGNAGGNGGNNGNGNGDNGNDGNDANEVEVTGTVAGLGGGCPAITFTAGGRSVATTSATEFDLACGSIANGTKVEVKGTSPSPSGTVTATRVKKEN